MPETDLDTRVNAGVEAWIAWLPRWAPSSARARVRVCRRCFGSPVIEAAALSGTPHQVQHALVSRIHAIIDADVAAFTAARLPLLHTELELADAEHRAARPYRPEEGLGPEFEGLGVDPEPVPGEPYLFTLTDLAAAEAETRAAPAAQPHALTDADKEQLRFEISLADDRAAQSGRAACLALVDHRERIEAAVAHFVTPKIDALMDELSAGLEAPGGRDSTQGGSTAPAS